MPATMETAADINARKELEAVAGIIYEHMASGLTDGLNWQDINEEGWTFEVRYEPQDANYVNDRDFTRVEGLTLSPERLAEAIRLAEEWLRRPPAYFTEQ